MWTHFVNDCLNSVDSRGWGGGIQRPFGETRHGTEVNSGNPDREQTPTDSDDGTKYILVLLKEDITWFCDVSACVFICCQRRVLAIEVWCTTLGVPSVLVSYRATHLKNHFLAKLTTLLGAGSSFCCCQFGLDQRYGRERYEGSPARAEGLVG
ncbi:unnamed protein product [Laminaria digitata]